MQRDSMIDRLRGERDTWDLLVIGGGATGVGVALDAAARGYRVALVEQHDLGKGTSSRSTKLIHGGVRYLQQGNLSLVMEALEERGILRGNAPHLIHERAFVVPNYEWWEAPFYGLGMKVYDVLARRYGFGQSRLLTREEVVERIPTIELDGLRGGVVYHDGQFDDSRLLVHLACTAADRGAAVATYTKVTDILHTSDGQVRGVRVRDAENGNEWEVTARAVVNAAGPFADAVRRLDDHDAQPMLRPSQGVHIVLDREFLPGDDAIMVPRTEDRRVLFAIPWHGRTLVGTTDTPVERATLEPHALPEEIDFLLRTAGRYLHHDPMPDDVLSVFTGIRPLVGTDAGAHTAELSRDHVLHVSASGLLTIGGGKWTTYRRMAEDVVDHAIVLGDLAPQPCVTGQLRIHGYLPNVEADDPLAVYGSDAMHLRELIRKRPDLAETIDPQLDVLAAEVVWAARHELARTVEDVLARRTRALLLDSRAAARAAPRVASLLATEIGRDDAWTALQIDDFRTLAESYSLPPG
jgi:glycerol-3-phosphate dehydrogenase